MPYLYNGNYICVPICDDNSIKQVHILLDYSNSLKTKDPEGKVQNIARKVITALNGFNESLNDKILVSVAREDLDKCINELVCDENVSTAPNRKVTGGPSNQKLCACNNKFTKNNGGKQGGGTIFYGGIKDIKDKEHTLAILISDGYVPDNSFKDKGFKKVIVVAEGYPGIKWDDVLPQDQYDFDTAMGEGFDMNKLIQSQLCISAADAEKLVPYQYCTTRDNWIGNN